MQKNNKPKSEIYSVMYYIFAFAVLLPGDNFLNENLYLILQSLFFSFTTYFFLKR